MKLSPSLPRPGAFLKKAFDHALPRAELDAIVAELDEAGDGRVAPARFVRAFVVAGRAEGDARGARERRDNDARRAAYADRTRAEHARFGQRADTKIFYPELDQTMHWPEHAAAQAQRAREERPATAWTAAAV